MKKNDKNEGISFIVPIYNSEQYLSDCISSILRQTYENWELLLIDDGSIDNTSNICKRFVELDNRISYYRKENEGVSIARNYGINRATKEFLCFVDSDDYLDSNFCVSALSHIDNGVSLVAFGMKRVYPNGTEEIVPNRIKSGMYRIKEIENIIIDDGTFSGFTFHSACSTLFRSSIIKDNNISFNIELSYNEDGLFVTEYLLNCYEALIFVDFSFTPYSYRVNQKSASNNLDLNVYGNNTKIIESVLSKYVDCNSLSEQLLLRELTVSVEKILRLKQVKYEDVRACFSRDKVCNALKYVNFSKLNFKKKVFFLLIKYRCFMLLKVIINSYL